MKRFSRMLPFLLTLIVLFSVMSPLTYADDPVSREYRITFYAGNHGTVNGESCSVEYVTYTPGGEKNTCTAPGVEVDEDSIYYFKGFRLSGHGKGNEEFVSGANIPVTEDAEYVAVYGIMGDQVSYTLKFVDEDGKELAESETFKGNIGDAPVVGCKYITGYTPSSKNITKELVANEAENVFEFTYTRNKVNTVYAEGQAADNTGANNNNNVNNFYVIQTPTPYYRPGQQGAGEGPQERPDGQENYQTESGNGGVPDIVEENIPDPQIPLGQRVLKALNIDTETAGVGTYVVLILSAAALSAGITALIMYFIYKNKASQ